MEKLNRQTVAGFFATIALAVLLGASGCGRLQQGKDRQRAETETATSADTAGGVSADSSPAPHDIPRFAANSPFSDDYKPPVSKESKRLWARSFLWEKPPDLVVEKWLTDRPETEGKYLLIEIWATTCSQCVRTIPLLNRLHRKYGEELAVIAISDETEENIRRLKKPRIEYHLAIDSQARTRKQLAVRGIPHVILLEPQGHVVWEGFPLLRGYKLTEAVVEKILSVGRELRVNPAVP